MSRETTPLSWRDDLKMARNVPESQKPGFELLLSWFEDWRIGRQLEPGREAACAFWRQEVKAKPRADWQIDQWKEAIGWFLEWLRFAQAAGNEVRTLEERVYQAMDRAGGRRGLARRTRETYGRWAARYARWAGGAREAMEQVRGRDFLTHLVTVEKQSFSSQKQALNALVFFFKEVCGHEEVDLQVKLRKTTKRIPVVVNFQEILAILARLEERYRLIAEVQYGGGLRLKELMRLRIKDIDIDRRQITIRQGKGDLDRVRGGGRAGGGALAVHWLPTSQRPATAGLTLNTPPLRARTMDEHERGRGRCLLIARNFLFHPLGSLPAEGPGSVGVRGEVGGD